MKILVFGGTGAMGVPLVELLSRADHDIFVTSRRERSSQKNIHYIKGNAKDDTFLEDLLANESYDVIVDFMVYNSKVFEKRVPLLLKKTKQYIFFSSSRVYANSQESITEESDRLLDVCENEEYLATDEYALTKAREEDMLRNSGKTNWTIIRPYITYNTQRLQLGVYEKENWLYRALKGRTIVFPKDIAERTTSLTFGDDVAKVVFLMIDNPKALGETFHIVTKESATWQQVFDIYLDVIEEKLGRRPKVISPENSNGLQSVWNKAQIKYDRLYDRIFDSSKTAEVCGEISYKNLREGISECLNDFLKDPRWLDINWRYEAWADKQAGELTPLSEIRGFKMKLRYLKWRFIG